MAFGSKESKEEKQERKIQELLTKYGMQDLTDPEDIRGVKQIAQNLTGNKITAAGLALSGKPYENAILTYQQAIVEQNFIIIRQLAILAEK